VLESKCAFLLGYSRMIDKKSLFMVALRTKRSLNIQKCLGNTPAVRRSVFLSLYEPHREHMSDSEDPQTLPRRLGRFLQRISKCENMTCSKLYQREESEYLLDRLSMERPRGIDRAQFTDFFFAKVSDVQRPATFDQSTGFQPNRRLLLSLRHCVFAWAFLRVFPSFLNQSSFVFDRVEERKDSKSRHSSNHLSADHR
jgi:hypothetical protein